MIYLVCPFCKTEQDVKNKTCKEMQQSMPKEKRTYKVVVQYQNECIVKRVSD
jgi:cobalamin biosynthesis Co2+ chelatase CbiK